MGKMTDKLGGKLIVLFKRFWRSVWLFPVLAAVPLILACSLQISGSSIGVYNQMFNGGTTDPSLITNQPRPIRSDEWIVTTQKTIAQYHNNYRAVNENIGNREDATLLADLPYKQWSMIFKPHNLGFFVLPFENAFALRWWLLSYLLLVSAYFFVITLLPGRRLLASLLSLGLLFSPFLHWWYTFGTFGSIYYALFGATAFIKLLHAKTWLSRLLWSTLFIYVSVGFALILYPPFQIPCLLVTGALCLGYLIDQVPFIKKSNLRTSLLYLSGALTITVMVVGIFLFQKHNIINVVANTAYPGQRVIKSGGYNAEHLLSSNLSPLFQMNSRAAAYAYPSIGATNQSESSNFILITPLLLIPIGYLMYRARRSGKRLEMTLILPLAMAVIFIAWLFTPGLDILGRLLLLDKVPHPRLLIGTGLLNFILLVLFVRLLNQSKITITRHHAVIYSLLVLLFYILLDFHVMTQFPGFIGYRSAIVYAIPLSVIVYCFLRKRVTLAALGLVLLGAVSVFHINPLYRSTTIITQSPIFKEIRAIGTNSNNKWVSDNVNLENFPAMAGEPSLTGTYTYPQIGLWDKLNLTEKRDTYNRYAHVSFTFDRDPQTHPPHFSQASPDSFNVYIEPCSEFLKENRVEFLITTVPFKSDEANCAQEIKAVTYPLLTFYIYRLVW